MARMMTIKEQLVAFCRPPFCRNWPRNVWIKDNKMEVYVRRANRMISGRYLLCLDIANVSVEEEFQRQGMFKQFIEDCFEVCVWDAVFIENVLNPDLAGYLDRTDWKCVSTPNTTPSFYKGIPVRKEVSNG